jgi:hypothetical protein
MNIQFKPEWLAGHPRFRVAREVPEAQAGQVTSLNTVSSVTFTVPSSDPVTVYGAITETTVIVPENPEEEPSIAGEVPVGGAELSEAEMLALPGAPQFWQALNNALLDRWQNGPPPPAHVVQT